MVTNTVGEKNIWSPADFVRLPTYKKNYQSIILMVGLFKQNSERQNNDLNNPEKTHLKKVIHWFAFLWVK